MLCYKAVGAMVSAAGSAPCGVAGADSPSCGDTVRTQHLVSPPSLLSPASRSVPSAAPMSPGRDVLMSRGGAVTHAGACIVKRPHPLPGGRERLVAQRQRLPCLRSGAVRETCRQNCRCLPSQLCRSSWLCGCAYTEALVQVFLLQGISGGIN